VYEKVILQALHHNQLITSIEIVKRRLSLMGPLEGFLNSHFFVGGQVGLVEQTDWGSCRPSSKIPIRSPRWKRKTTSPSYYLRIVPAWTQLKDPCGNGSSMYCWLEAMGCKRIETPLSSIESHWIALAIGWETTIGSTSHWASTIGGKAKP
jgi:hypothetical protein